jgi:hypothetical protein
MRQVSIPKNIVEALNSLFDAHPAAVAELMTARASTADPVEARIAREQAVVDAAAGAFPLVPIGAGEPSIGILDVINAVLDSVAPGKRINTIHGPDGLDGFVLGRDRKVAAPPAEA